MIKRQTEEIKLTPDQIRRLQLVELDILLELDRICRKYNINYFLCGGTLLGAVRHKGFIPWDDDVDIGFLRVDYERFCKVFAQETDLNKYFLQTWKTDKNYRWSYGKIRRLGTEYVRSGQEHMKYVSGISIDIFPYDYLPFDLQLQKDLEKFSKWQIIDDFHRYEVIDSKFLKVKEMQKFRTQAFICGICRKILYSVVGKYQEPQLSVRLLFTVLALIPSRPVLKIMEENAQKYNDIEKYGGIRIRQFSYANDIIRPNIGWLAEKLKEFSEIEFEGFNFYMPKDYHWYLTGTYGTHYMELPPDYMRHGVAPVSKIDFGNVFAEMTWCTNDFFIPSTKI